METYKHLQGVELLDTEIKEEYPIHIILGVYILYLIAQMEIRKLFMRSLKNSVIQRYSCG